MKYVLNVLLHIVSMLYTATVFVIGWDTFVVPLGVPAVGMVHAMGLVTLVGLLSIGRDTAVSQIVIATEASIKYWQSWVVYQIVKTISLVLLLLLKVLM